MNPGGDITWFLDGDILGGETGAVLDFGRGTMADSGNYTCRVSNDISEKEFSTLIIVTGEVTSSL